MDERWLWMVMASMTDTQILAKTPIMVAIVLNIFSKFPQSLILANDFLWTPRKWSTPGTLLFFGALNVLCLGRWTRQFPNIKVTVVFWPVQTLFSRGVNVQMIYRSRLIYLYSMVVPSVSCGIMKEGLGKAEDCHETSWNHEANIWRNFSRYGNLHMVDLDPF